MTRIRLHPRKFKLVYILALAIVSLPLTHSRTWAQNLGSDSPATDRRRGLGTRGSCPVVDKPLTVLVGSTQTKAETTKILPVVTIADHPTWWFYVPYSPDYRLSAEFTLFDEGKKDEGEKNVYKTTFPLKEKPGIIGLKLPETLPPLQVGKHYRWNFSVVCNPGNRFGDLPVSVSGSLDRIPLNSTLQAELEKTPDSKVQSDLYAKNGLWFEALTALAQGCRSNLKDRTLQIDWSTLLSKSMNLNDIASEPLTRCYTPKESK